MNFEDMPGVMGRSNLRAKALIGGYNIVDVRTDSIIFVERKPGTETLRQWTAVAIATKTFEKDKKFPRPDYSMNNTYSRVTEQWQFSSDANVISTPVVADGLAVFGNQKGEVVALSLMDGGVKWRFKTDGSIFSSPAASNGSVVFGSGDGNIYCLDIRTGSLWWKTKAGAAVLGSPLIDGNSIYIGASDHTFRKLNLKTGQVLWSFTSLAGPVVSTPVLYKGKIIFGAWDRNLYAVSVKNGELLWKWNNGSAILNYSPAACIPVVHNDVVYVVAPDRYITAINCKDGKTLWRNNDATVRESIGISKDGKVIYGKTMQDTIVAYTASREKQTALWKMHVGFGYEHVPSMLIERGGIVFFGTKNGVVYAIDPLTQKINWAYKIDNSMVNTVRVIDKTKLIAATMDGKIVLLKVNEN
jgi:outer membrane protein assembly factor BamB